MHEFDCATAAAGAAEATADGYSRTLGEDTNLFSKDSVQCSCPTPTSAAFFDRHEAADAIESCYHAGATTTPTIISVSEQLRAIRTHFLPLSPIVPVLPSSGRASEKIPRKVIDGANIERRNTSISVQRRKKNRRRRRPQPSLDFCSFFFTPFSRPEVRPIEMANGEADNGQPADVSGHHHIKRKRKLDFPDNDVSSSSPSGGPIPSRTTSSLSSNWKMVADSRGRSGRSAFFLHLLTTLFCCYCLSSLSKLGCTASLVQGSTTPSIPGDELVHNYDDSRELERRGGDRQPRYKKLYTNQWAVEIVDGSDDIAEQIARRHGFTYLGRVVGNYFLFASDRMRRKRSTRRARYLQYELGREPQVRVDGGLFS